MSGITIPKGERVIARGTQVIGEQSHEVVATNIALRARDLTLRWDQIESATWDEPTLLLTVRRDPAGALERLTMQLEGTRSLIESIRDRVTASVLTSQRRALPSGEVATFAARRRSDDGSISWTVVFDGNPDLSNPQIRHEADAVLTDLRESLGI